MKTAFQLAMIVCLLGIYAAALLAVLRPHVSPQYKTYFIERTSDEFQPQRYHSTPEEGMEFGREGLPDWVASTHGLSFPDSGGRWTDNERSPVATISFDRNFEGELCVDVTARGVPWIVGQSIGVKMGGEKRDLQISSADLSEYRLQFESVKDANRLDFILPRRLPAVMQKIDSRDSRRLGINISRLQIAPGQCPGPAQ